MLDLKKFISGFARDERGASLVEYSILIGLIAALTITAISSVGGTIVSRWQALDAIFN